MKPIQKKTFKKGKYHSLADDFKESLKEYIEYKRRLLKDIKITDPNMVYVLSDNYFTDGTPWTSLDKAVNLALKASDIESFSIIKQKLNSGIHNRIIIEFKPNIGVTNVCFEIPQPAELNIENAYAEIPHDYKIGDIIKHNEEYAVVTDITKNDINKRLSTYVCNIDINLYCLGYYYEPIHSCGGSFCREYCHFLETEKCSDDDLSEVPRPLIALSKTLKGEYKFADFIEMYSDGRIEDILK